MKKNSILYCERILYQNITELLNEIFRKLINYNIFNGFCPENILLTEEEYKLIKKERSNVISSKEDGNYILCMKVVLKWTKRIKKLEN